MHARRLGAVVVLACSASLLWAAPPDAPEAEKPKVDIRWQDGPGTAKLDDFAEIALPPGYRFAAAGEARKLLEHYGNPTNGNEKGLVVDAEGGWFAIFEWHDVGYVKDDDGADIDADALLASIREGTEQANEYRKAHQQSALHVTGWIEKPHYDATTHNLVWGLKARDDDGTDVVNYNVRVLGRHGYMSVTLVDSPERLDTARAGFAKVLGGFGYTGGNRYAEYSRGDRVAEIGLAALVAGGAGAAAAKLGLFGKLGKLIAASGKAIVLALVAGFALLRRLFTRLFRGAEPSTNTGELPGGAPPRE